jgi:tRNA threonylcarbamoyladenosine biosynthesis protein TsaE
VILAQTKSADDTRALAGGVASVAGPGDVVVLAGDLGAGKTVFAQGFGRGLGVTEPVTSPTFTLVRPYQGRLPLIHVDVYRLDHLQEALEIGLVDLLDESGVTLVEWGDMVTPVLPAEFLEVRIEPGSNDDERVVRFRPLGPGWTRRMEALRRSIGRWLVEDG